MKTFSLHLYYFAYFSDRHLQCQRTTDHGLSTNGIKIWPTYSISHMYWKPTGNGQRGVKRMTSHESIWDNMDIKLAVKGTHYTTKMYLKCRFWGSVQVYYMASKKKLTKEQQLSQFNTRHLNTWQETSMLTLTKNSKRSPLEFHNIFWQQRKWKCRKYEA